MKLSNSWPRRLRWLNLPTVSLLALLQRSPAVRVALQVEEFVMASPIGAVLKSLAATAASLGAMNSLVGATPLVPSSGVASGVDLTAGTAMTPIGFTVTPTETPIRSWHVGGTIPAGLNFSNRTSSGTVNTQNLLLSGVPTTAGDYMVTLQAFDQLNEGGFPSAVYSYTIRVAGSVAMPPAIVTQPETQIPNAGGNIVLTAGVSGSPAPTVQWRKNGANVSGATSTTLTLNSVQPADTGLYTLAATNSAGTAETSVALVGVLTTQKVIGFGSEFSANVPHPNGNIFDQILPDGAAVSFTADANQVTRASYIDDDDDIVQVEFSGPGTLSLVLTGATSPAAPVNYNQPNVAYVKGHAAIVITGADEHTNVSVFTVGRATAFDPTGAYNFLTGPSETNDPAKNGSPLFVGHETTSYDGMADIAFIAIATTNGKFGGVRTSNATYYASSGYTGIYAPGVAFQGPLFVSDVSAFDTATPVLIVGSVADARVTGGDMSQPNGQAVLVSGISQLKFTPGSDSHGHTFAAQSNQAVYKRNGADVTSQIVVNP